jgi:HAD superfamily hydrolase (TIGR01509 family)
VKCILFDLDGTLFDTADAIRKAVEETRDEFQLDIDVDYVVADTVTMLAGRKSRMNFLIIASHYGVFTWKNPLQVLKIKTFYEERFSTYTRESTLLPEVKESLKALRNFRLAVVTAREKQWTEISLKKHNILHYFEVVVTTDDVKREKPYPDSILKAVDFLDVNPAECLYVGDLPSDIRAGKRAGVKTAAILTGLSSRERLEKECPDFVFGTLKELAFNVRSHSNHSSL